MTRPKLSPKLSLENGTRATPEAHGGAPAQKVIRSRAFASAYLGGLWHGLAFACEMERTGLEPVTAALQRQCSPN